MSALQPIKPSGAANFKTVASLARSFVAVISDETSFPCSSTTTWLVTPTFDSKSVSSAKLFVTNIHKKALAIRTVRTATVIIVNLFD